MSILYFNTKKNDDIIISINAELLNRLFRIFSRNEEILKYFTKYILYVKFCL